jgi:hypothetical protein
VKHATPHENLFICPRSKKEAKAVQSPSDFSESLRFQRRQGENPQPWSTNYRWSQGPHGRHGTHIYIYYKYVYIYICTYCHLYGSTWAIGSKYHGSQQPLVQPSPLESAALLVLSLKLLAGVYLSPLGPISRNYLRNYSPVLVS